MTISRHTNRTAYGALFAALAVVVMAGCTTDPVVVAAPADSIAVAPAIPAQAEADDDPYAIATDAFADYVAMSDAIAADGGTNPQRIAGLVTAGWLEHEIAGFAALDKAGLRQRGSTEITRTELTYSAQSAGVTEVAFYACHSSRTVTVVDASDRVVSPSPSITLLSVYVLIDDTGAHIDSIVPAADSQWCAS